MKRLFLAVLSLFIGCAKSSAPPEVRGKGVFATYDCKRCHRIGLEGGVTGPDLTFAGFRKSAEFLDLWLKDPSAWQPDTMMPNFHFNEGSRKALATYLATLKGEAYGYGPRPWSNEKDPVRRGAMIYERVGCATCHGKNGKGGYKNNNVIGGEIPALTRVAGGFTREELIKRIADGVPRPVRKDPSGPAPLLNMPAWKEKLTPADIAAVADYVLTLAPKEEAADQW